MVLQYRYIGRIHPLNPLCCLNYNGEANLDPISLDPDLAESIASWWSVYRALYLLWLEAGEYSNWAA